VEDLDLEAGLQQRVGDVHDAERRIHVALVAEVDQEDRVRCHACPPL
jgi:hypothetical protein